MKTDITNSTPLYSQVVEDLRNKILNGTYRRNDRLPNEKWLCDLYNISRSTLRKSIDELILDGFLERKTNRGVYVIYSKFDTDFDHPYSLFQEMVKSGIVPTSKILSFMRIEADKRLSAALGCKLKAPLLEIYRLRYADDVPFNLQYIYLPESIFSQFNPWLLIDHSLYDLIENEYHLKIQKTVQKVSTALVTKEQTELLNVPARTPLLHTTSTVYSNGRIIEYQENDILTDVVPYSYKVTKNR